MSLISPKAVEYLASLLLIFTLSIPSWCLIKTQRNKHLQPDAPVRPGLTWVPTTPHYTAHCVPWPSTALWLTLSLFSQIVFRPCVCISFFLSREEDKDRWWVFSKREIEAWCWDLGISSCFLVERHLKVNTTVRVGH